MPAKDNTADAMDPEGQQPETGPEEGPLAWQNAGQRREREQTAESERRGEEPAQRPTAADEEHSIFGQSLGGRREIAGGGNIQEHVQETPPDRPRDPLYFHRRYMASRLRREAGDIIARAPENIGFWGKGDTYRGNGGILVDVDTLEKHRFPDGWKFLGEEVYANSRDLPHALVEGDMQKNLSGEGAATGR